LHAIYSLVDFRVTVQGLKISHEMRNFFTRVKTASCQRAASTIVNSARVLWWANFAIPSVSWKIMSFNEKRSLLSFVFKNIYKSSAENQICQNVGWHSRFVFLTWFLNKNLHPCLWRNCAEDFCIYRWIGQWQSCATFGIKFILVTELWLWLTKLVLVQNYLPTFTSVCSVKHRDIRHKKEMHEYKCYKRKTATFQCSRDIISELQLQPASISPLNIAQVYRLGTIHSNMILVYCDRSLGGTQSSRRCLLRTRRCQCRPSRPRRNLKKNC